MKIQYTLILVLCSVLGFSQSDEEQLEIQTKATDLVYEANELVRDSSFVEAEMAYRKALSKAPSKATGSYNLAHSYFKKGNLNEALFRNQEAAKNATTKDEKHRAFHNLGNILMKNEMCKEAAEAFKNALRSNPNDEETRYNFALAKKCVEDKKKDDGGEDDKKDKSEDDKDKKEDENKDKKDEEDKGDKDKKDGDDKEDDKGKPKDDKKDDKKKDGEGDKDKKNKKNTPKPGKMSPQQMKNILEAMQNQEQKVQQKINAKKQKGAKIKTEKDW